MGTRPKRATQPSVSGTLALARRHKAGAEDNEGGEDRWSDSQYKACRGDGGGCRPANRRKGLGESRYPRGHLTAAELAALELAAKPELDRRRRRCGNDDPGGRNQRMPGRRQREDRDERREYNPDDAEYRFDLGPQDKARWHRSRGDKIRGVFSRDR